MAENKTRRAGSTSSHLEEIFRERERLDQILQRDFKKEVTVLFTDICGYTDYTDTRGDISGRALLMKHNRIVLPLVEKRQLKPRWVQKKMVNISPCSTGHGIPMAWLNSRR